MPSLVYTLYVGTMRQSKKVTRVCLCVWISLSRSLFLEEKVMLILIVQLLRKIGTFQPNRFLTLTSPLLWALSTFYALYFIRFMLFFMGPHWTIKDTNTFNNTNPLFYSRIPIPNGMDRDGLEIW